MKQQTTIAIIIAMILMAGCQKDNSPAPDPSKVTLTVTTPVDSATYYTGDTVKIAADALYIAEMHGFDISIRDQNDSAVFEDDVHAHGSHIYYNNYWVDTCTTDQLLKLIVVAEIDHNGNEREKVIYIKTRKR